MMTFVKYMKDNNQLATGRVALGVKADEGLDIFKMQVFGTDFVFVTELDAIEEIITNDPKRFTKNFSSIPTIKYTRAFLGNGLFFADTASEDWIIPHNILKAPFSTKGVRTLMPMMNEQADLLVKCLKKEVGYGGVCHIDHWVTKMAFETIAVCATGTSFGSFDDDQDHPFIKALNNVISGFEPMMTTPPSLWPIFFRKQLAQIETDGRFLRDTCIEVIRKRRRKETETSSGKKDVMDMMLEDKDPKSSIAMTDEQIVDNVLTFLFAGQDSTAAAMATLLCYLNANPRCKEKLFREIADVVGNGQLEWDHLSQLQYLDWCMKESMRLVPPAAAVARVANGDQLLQEKWRIPANTMCLIGIMAVHYDKKIWGEDACEFRPERWENGPPHKYAFIPFAVGPRACTGREFTLIEQKITFVKLLQNFDFRRPADVEAQAGYTTLKKDAQTMAPFIDMDVEFKTTSAFVGLFSAFELLERKC
jgi:cytochrome P450/NADPH-cytochrome P450 reductase